jgi:hypothetical protein
MSLPLRVTDAKLGRDAAETWRPSAQWLELRPDHCSDDVGMHTAIAHADMPADPLHHAIDA